MAEDARGADDLRGGRNQGDDSCFLLLMSGLIARAYGSGRRLPEDRAIESHAIVKHSADLDDTIGSGAVEKEMPWVAHFSNRPFHVIAAIPEMVNTCAS
jgi:hypothetical protein